MAAPEVEPRLCRLEQAVGVEAACPEDACPFWEPGGAVLEGRCVFEKIDFSRERDVARWLLRMRQQLDEGTSAPGR
jgi:hypothetical protein